MDEIRVRELAELAISYLFDNGLLDDFCEDRSVELTENEREYFGVDDDYSSWEKEICDEYQNMDATYFWMTGDPWDV